MAFIYQLFNTGLGRKQPGQINVRQVLLSRFLQHWSMDSLFSATTGFALWVALGRI